MLHVNTSKEQEMPKTCTVVVFDATHIHELFCPGDGFSVQFMIGDTVQSALVIQDIDTNIKEFTEYDAKEVADIFFEAAKKMVTTKNTGSNIRYIFEEGKLTSVMVYIGAKLEAAQQ